MKTPDSKHPQEVVDSVMDKLLEGASVEDLAATTGIPSRTIRRWREAHYAPLGEEKRHRQREAFVAVMDSFNSIRAVLGQIQAMDYSKMTEGSGAQYGTTDRTHQVIDYQVDVMSAVEASLTPAQLVFFNERLKDQDLEEVLLVQDTAFMDLQEKLGRIFIARELFPVTSYFKVVKQKKGK